MIIFKKIARISNFKNIPCSVAKRHQRLLCAYLQGPFFTYHDLECGPCNRAVQYIGITTVVLNLKWYYILLGNQKY